MLTYRGDKFIKGKKFTINESVYRFQKRDNNDNLIFESDNGEKIKLTESEFNKATLKEDEDEQSMIDVVKDYYENGNSDARFKASEYISKYAMDDRYPELRSYIKKLLDRNHGKEEYHSVGGIDGHILSVADEFGVDFDNKTPFEYFYAPDSDGEDEDDQWYSSDYDWADFYDRILHDMGYGENPILNDCRAEVHEVSDGKDEMILTHNGTEYTVDLRAWDKLEDVKNNVYAIIDILKNKK